VKVISTGTGAPPKRAGANRKPCAAATTAASKGAWEGVRTSTFVTVPITSTSSLTVTTTREVIGGAPGG
jgi:hypothetical protein